MNYYHELKGKITLVEEIEQYDIIIKVFKDENGKIGELVWCKKCGCYI